MCIRDRSRRLEMILSQPHYGCLLAERNGEILGFLGYAKLFFFEADGSCLLYTSPLNKFGFIKVEE